MNQVNAKIEELLGQINSVILNKEEQVKMIFATWLMGGHVLLEDLPGTGKTVLAKSFSKACQVSFGRVQFTPDLLPNDILGTTIYDQETKKFFFKKGALFSDFFLADEINRATPRTQAALLEAMGERQITVENKTTKLSESFFVMATQNPIESHGTFPLPEAQLDRFTIKISLGFLDNDSELKMIKSQLESHPLEKLKAVISEDSLIKLKSFIPKIKIDDEILRYVLKIINGTRSHIKIKHGASPRGSIALTKMAQAYALISGRNHVIPSDVYKLAGPVLNHRVLLTEDAQFEGMTSEDIIKDILKSCSAPKV